MPALIALRKPFIRLLPNGHLALRWRPIAKPFREAVHEFANVRDLQMGQARSPRTASQAASARSA